MLDFSPKSATFKILGCCPANKVKGLQGSPAKWLGINIALVVGFVELKHSDFTSYIFNRPKKNSRLTEFVQGLRRRSNL